MADYGFILKPLHSEVFFQEVTSIYQQCRYGHSPSKNIAHIADVLQTHVEEAVKMLYGPYLYLFVERHAF
jgi:hypothetical protein